MVAAYNQPVSFCFYGAGNLIVFHDDGGLWRSNVGCPQRWTGTCAIARTQSL
jgi:hypothetical protein